MGEENSQSKELFQADSQEILQQNFSESVSFSVVVLGATGLAARPSCSGW
jgi:hypothetical protein